MKASKDKDRSKTYAQEQYQEHRHYLPRGPRQDDARRRDAQADRDLQRPRGPGGPRDGFARPRTRAGHHDHGQEHGHLLQGDEDQHLRHPRPCRFRRGGRAEPQHGGRGDAPGRRERGTAAADALRPEEGACPGDPHRPGHQQDRPPRRPDRRGDQRGLRPLHRPRRDGGADRVPDPVHERQDRRRPPEARGTNRRISSRSSRRSSRRSPGRRGTTRRRRSFS